MNCDLHKKNKKTIYALWGVADSAALWGYEIALFLSFIADYNPINTNHFQHAISRLKRKWALIFAGMVDGKS